MLPPPSPAHYCLLSIGHSIEHNQYLLFFRPTRVDIMNYSVGSALPRTRMNVRMMRLRSSHLAPRPLATSFINIYNKLPRRAESQ